MKAIDQAPANACLMSGGAVTFADAAEGSKTHPIRMLARSSQPIDHWFWGRVVHDMSGYTLHKERIAVDYIHDEPIGYLDKFAVTDEGLVVEGALVLTDDPTDPAPKMMKRHRGGVPFEASINFGGDGLKYEYIGEGQVATVNGYQFDGPGIVIREWPLRGVAVCPYGADMNTESQFSRAAETFSVSQINGEPMKTATQAAAELKADEQKPAEPQKDTAATELKAPEQKPAEPAKALEANDPRAEMNRFREAFGDDGLKFYADGLSFEAAQQKANASLLSRLTAIETQLAAVAKVTGEEKPATFDASGDKKDGPKGFASKIRFSGQPKATA